MDNVNNKPNTETSSEKPKKKKWSLKKKLGVIFGSIALVILALVVIANMATSAPLSASDRFVYSIRNVNAATAYSMFSRDAKAVVNESQFEQIVDQIGPILSGAMEVQSKEVSAETGSNATAKIVYKIKGNDSRTYIFTVNLVNENNEWKVLNFDSDAE